MRLPGRSPVTDPEAGETLIEVLMASALMATVVLAIIGGMSTMLLGSSIHRKQADANTALLAASEQLKSPDTARACTYSGLPSGIAITTLEYQTVGPPDASGNPTVLWSTDVADCDLASPLTLQRITIQYSTPDSRVTPSLSFVKGDF